MKYLILSLICWISFCFQNTMTQREKELTYELISRLAYKSTAHLLYNHVEIRGIGKKIDHVPPLQFFSFIVTHPELKPALRAILNGFFTKPHFVDGAEQKLRDQKKIGILQQELEGFSLYIHKDYQCLKEYVSRNDWIAFINYIAD